MGDAGVSGSMIALAREAQGWKQSDLAQLIQVSQGFVSKVERGLLALDEEGLADFAQALRVPVALLREDNDLPGLALTCLHHRRRASRIPATSAKRIESLAQLVGLSVRRLAAGEEVGGRLPLVRHALDSGLTPAELAAKVRADWGLPPGPIEDVVELLERAGITIVIRKLGTDAQDAVSMWPPGTNPLIMVNTGLPPDRARFTLVHELGHLLMHEFPDEEQEDQANAFAAAFLLPADQIRPELDGLTVRQFPRLAELKTRWKVSMAALIQRAHHLEIISPSQYKSFRIRLNDYGWSKREPGALTPETPTLLSNRIRQHLDNGLSEGDLADLALMLPEQFTRHYLPTTAQPHAAAPRNQ